MEDVKKRTFGGKLSGFTDRSEANFEKKHLKAYLKGHEFFRHGFRMSDGVKFPSWHITKEEYV